MGGTQDYPSGGLMKVFTLSYSNSRLKSCPRIAVNMIHKIRNKASTKSIKVALKSMKGKPPLYYDPQEKHLTKKRWRNFSVTFDVGRSEVTTGNVQG